ncbi:Lebercilin-like protein [Trichoplax sp. H2]|nr:Lebercilin-like protein [Trichoplax sp. H2]|eukprot:RDD37540.1 Lebercilin-like protein [Trichoplax sp. H2]
MKEKQITPVGMASYDSRQSSKSYSEDDYSTYDDDFEDGNSLRSRSRSRTPERAKSPRKGLKGSTSKLSTNRAKGKNKSKNAKKVAGLQRHYAGSATNNYTSKPKDFVAQQLLNANRSVITELQDKLADMKRQIKDLKEENKILKNVQQRQSKALTKYEGQDAELPSLIQNHMREVNNLRERLRKTQENLQTSQQQMKEKDDRLWKLEDKNKKLKVLVEDNNLAEREKLSTEVDELKQKLADRDKKIMDLEKSKELEINFKNRDMKEQGKRFKHTQQTLDSALQENRQLQHALKEKERELDLLNIYSVRQSKGNGKLLTDRSEKDTIDSILSTSLKHGSHNIQKEREEIEKRLAKEKEKQKEEEKLRQEELRRKEEEEKRRQKELDEQRKLEQERRYRHDEQLRRDEEERRAKLEAERQEEERRRRRLEDERRQIDEEEKRQREERERRQREEDAQRRQVEEERMRQEEERLAAEKAAEERRKKDELLARLRASETYKNDTIRDKITLSSPPEQIDDDSGRGTGNDHAIKSGHKANFKTENLHQGRPALSTDDDYYGTKNSKSSKSTTLNSNDSKQGSKPNSAMDEDLSPRVPQKPIHGRRAYGNTNKTPSNHDPIDVFGGGDDGEDFLLDTKPKKSYTTSKKDTILLDDDDDDDDDDLDENPFQIPANRSNPTSRGKSRNRDGLFDSPQGGSRNDHNKSKSSSVFGDNDDDFFHAKPNKSSKTTTAIQSIDDKNDDDGPFDLSENQSKSYPWGKKESNGDRVTLGRPRAKNDNIIAKSNKTAIEDFGFDDDLEEINL